MSPATAPRSSKSLTLGTSTLVIALESGVDPPLDIEFTSAPLSINNFIIVSVSVLNFASRARASATLSEGPASVTQFDNHLIITSH